MVVSNFSIWRSAALMGFRAMVIGQMMAVFTQALLAGLALSGSEGSLAKHLMIGRVALIFSILQVVFGLLARNNLPKWVLAASVGLFLGEAAQMASGHLFLLAIHLPLGLALFATVVPLVLWIVRGSRVMRDHGRMAAPADAVVRTA